MTKVIKHPELEKKEQIEENSKKDPFTLHLQSAYDWYKLLREKENPDYLEMASIIEIEEKHKLEIISQYHKHLRNEK